MKIGNFNTEESVLVIAEIGNNHEGDFALAQDMIGLAAEAGADAVKFQTFIPELYVSSSDSERIQRLREFQLTFNEFEKLANQARAAGVHFISTPFDIESAKFLNTIQSVFKISSGDNTFYPLIRTVAEFGKPMFVSSGLADMQQLENTYNYILNIWENSGTKAELAFLHCVSCYPVPENQANLSMIPKLKESFPGVLIGYSDHTLGTEAATYAVATGARIVEKHFTVSKSHSDFRDHQLSADPDEMKRLVKAIRHASTLVGNSGNEIQPCEKNITASVRRSVAAARDIPESTELVTSDLTWVRPGTGIPPGDEQRLLGQKTKREIKQGEIIKIEDLV